MSNSTHSKINIGKDYTKGFDTDISGRKDISSRLISLFQNSTTPMIVALDGRWGTGKTEFVKKMQGEIEKSAEEVTKKATEKPKLQVIYFDAFANDYIDNAFIAMAGEIIEKFRQDPSIVESIVKVAKTLTMATAGNIASRLVTLGISKATSAITTATGGMLDASTIDDIKKAFLEEETDRMKEIVTKRKGQKEEIEQFRELLSQLSSNAPLVFIVDELDRCKPTFSLQVIEAVKHFFSVKNVHFLLVMNHSQMEHSVKSQYGQDINATEYLQKFYTCRVGFPKSDFNKIYINHLAEGSDFWAGHGAFLKHFSFIINSNPDITLRDTEKMLINIEVAYNMNESYLQKNASCEQREITSLNLYLISVLCFLKIKHADLLDKLISGGKLDKDADIYGKIYKNNHESPEAMILADVLEQMSSEKEIEFLGSTAKDTPEVRDRLSIDSKFSSSYVNLITEGKPPKNANYTADLVSDLFTLKSPKEHMIELCSMVNSLY